MSQRTELLCLLAHLAAPKPWLSCLSAGQPLLHVCWDPEWGSRAVYQKGFQNWKQIMDFWGKILSSFQNSIIKSVERNLLVGKLCASVSRYEQLPKLTAQWAERALCSCGGFWSAWLLLINSKNKCSTCSKRAHKLKQSRQQLPCILSAASRGLCFMDLVES